MLKFEHPPASGADIFKKGAMVRSNGPGDSTMARDEHASDELTTRAREMLKLLGVTASEVNQKSNINTRGEYVYLHYRDAVRVALKIWGEDVQMKLAMHAQYSSGTLRTMFGDTWPGNIPPTGRAIIFDLAVYALVAKMEELG